MERVVLDAPLVLHEGFEAFDMSCCTHFERHRRVSVSFPPHIAAPLHLRGEIVMVQLRLQTVHDRIVLTRLIGLPTEETDRTGKAQRHLVSRYRLTHREVKKISGAVKMTFALRLFSTRGLDTYAHRHLRDIFGPLAMEPLVMQDLHVRYSWSLVFYLMAGLFIALWLYHSWALPKPSEDGEKMQKTVYGILNEFKETLFTFFQKPQVFAGICFMLFYRMPEGLLAKVSALFLVDAGHNGGLGLSDGEYGLVQGTVGVIGLTLGGILGGIAASRDGLKRWLWPMVMAITLPDLVYIYLSYALPSSLLVVNICVFIEQFGYGFGFSAYMLYLIYYSQGEHKTSHYALCTAFMALSMMIPGLFAGALQEAVGYKTFFLIVVAACSLTYVVTWFLKIDPEFGKKEKE